MSKWMTEKNEICDKCSGMRRPRTAWDASVALGGAGNAFGFINSMFQVINKTTEKSPSANLSSNSNEPQQNDNTLHTLYRRDRDRTKTTKSQFEEKSEVMANKQNTMPQVQQQNSQHTSAPHNDSKHTSMHHVPSKHNEPHNNPIVSKPNLLKQRRRLRNFKSIHNQPPFLYEHYPLRPALLYGSPSSFICDPLKRLHAGTYMSPNSIQSIASPLPDYHASVGCKEKLKVGKNLNVLNVEKSVERAPSPHLIHARLKSGREGDNKKANTTIGESALHTKQAYAMKGESAESVCPTCHRGAFLFPPDPRYDIETTIAFEHDDDVENTENRTSSEVDFRKSKRLDLSAEAEDSLGHQDSLLFQSKYKRQRFVEPIEDEEKDLNSEENQFLSTPQLSVSNNTLEREYNESLPIFERLTKSDFKNYSNQPALKQKDSMLFYKDFKEKSKQKSSVVNPLEARDGEPTGFVRFDDEVALAGKPSDEDLIFGSAKGQPRTAEGWEKSRIDWLAELERRQEVRRRRKRRLERKWQDNASGGYFEKCSTLCRRLRMWWARLTTGEEY